MWLLYVWYIGLYEGEKKGRGQVRLSEGFETGGFWAGGLFIWGAFGRGNFGWGASGGELMSTDPPRPNTLNF